METTALDGFVDRVKANRDTADGILDGLKKAMRKRGHRRPTQDIEERVNLNEVDELLRSLDDENAP